MNSGLARRHRVTTPDGLKVIENTIAFHFSFRHVHTFWTIIKNKCQKQTVNGCNYSLTISSISFCQVIYLKKSISKNLSARTAGPLLSSIPSASKVFFKCQNFGGLSVPFSSDAETIFFPLPHFLEHLSYTHQNK